MMFMQAGLPPTANRSEAARQRYRSRKDVLRAVQPIAIEDEGAPLLAV